MTLSVSTAYKSNPFLRAEFRRFRHRVHSERLTGIRRHTRKRPESRARLPEAPEVPGIRAVSRARRPHLSRVGASAFPVFVGAATISVRVSAAHFADGIVNVLSPPRRLAMKTCAPRHAPATTVRPGISAESVHLPGPAADEPATRPEARRVPVPVPAQSLGVGGNGNVSGGRFGPWRRSHAAHRDRPRLAADSRRNAAEAEGQFAPSPPAPSIFKYCIRRSASHGWHRAKPDSSLSERAALRTGLSGDHGPARRPSGTRFAVRPERSA